MAFAIRKGAEARYAFDIKDALGVLQTGKTAADLTIALHANGVNVSPHGVVIVEDAGGYYYAKWTPALGGNPPVPYLLDLEETGAGLAGRQHRPEFQSFDSIPIPAGPTGDLSSLEAIRTWLGYQVGENTGNDAFLTIALSRQSEWIKQRSGRVITQASVTEVHDGRGVPRIQLRDGPIISVTSVHEDLDHAFGASSLIDPDDYYVDQRRCQIFRKGNAPWISWPNSLQVVYLAGWASIPLWIERYAIVKVCQDLMRRDGDELSSVTLKDGTIVKREPGGDSKEDRHFYAQLRRGGGIL
jgi:hypothetical protein